MAKTDVKEVQKGAQTFCGSVKYLAPEMLKKIGHGQSLDWYLLGVLLYEMLVGITPYFSNNKDELFDNIINGKLKLPRNISAESKSIIICLLNRNPVKRLGSKPGFEGTQEIMNHPFFLSINWEDLIAKKMTGNFVPDPPRYSIKDFEDEFTETEFTQMEINELYHGKFVDPTKEKKYQRISGWEYRRPEEEAKKPEPMIQN